MQREKCILVTKGSKTMNLFQKEQKNEKENKNMQFKIFITCAYIDKQ